MHDPPPEPPDAASVPSLRAAIRVARVEDAERSGAVADLRDAVLARLDLLQEALAPVLAQVPADADMFDGGLVPVPHPRLFVDMVAHVEMGHDRRLYRFIQATRHGRTVLAESEHVDTLVEAVTAYIARRLVERDRALSGTERPDPGSVGPPTPTPLTPTPRRARGAWLVTATAVLLDYLGLVALLALAVEVLRYAPWRHLLR